MSRPGERTINAHGPAKDSARAPAGEGLQIKSPRTFQVKELLSRPANFTCLAWTCDGDSLVAGSQDGTLRKFDTSTQKADWSSSLTTSANHVDCIAPNPANSRHIAAAVSDPRSFDNAAIVHFDARSSKAGGKPESSDSLGNAALALAWHPSGTRLGVSRKNGKFSIYDIRKLGSKPKAVCEKTLGWELNKFLFFGSGDRIVASYGHKSRGGYKVLKATDLTQLLEFECHIMPCVGLATSPDGALLATGGNDACVTVWSTASSLMLNCIYQPDSHCNHVGISHDGSMLAYSGANADGRVVSIEIAERFDDPGANATIHKLTADTVSSSSPGLSGCSVSDLSWNPKHALLAFCGNTSELSHLACVSRTAAA